MKLLQIRSVLLSTSTLDALFYAVLSIQFNFLIFDSLFSVIASRIINPHNFLTIISILFIVVALILVLTAYGLLASISNAILLSTLNGHSYYNDRKSVRMRRYVLICTSVFNMFYIGVIIIKHVYYSYFSSRRSNARLLPSQDLNKANYLDKDDDFLYYFLYSDDFSSFSIRSIGLFVDIAFPLCSMTLGTIKVLIHR